MTTPEGVLTLLNARIVIPASLKPKANNQHQTLPANCHQDITDVIEVCIQGDRESTLPWTEEKKSYQDGINALHPYVVTISWFHHSAWEMVALPETAAWITGYLLTKISVLCEKLIQEWLCQDYGVAYCICMVLWRIQADYFFCLSTLAYFGLLFCYAVTINKLLIC